MVEVKTRAEQASVLAEAGVTGPAAELLLARSAGERHRGRVLAAEAAAMSAARCGCLACGARRALDGAPLAAPEAENHAHYARAWLYCLADAIGVGGCEGLAGDGTARVPDFRSLGSGRKHAGDGEAWTAAIRAARHRLARRAKGEDVGEYDFLFHDEAAFDLSLSEDGEVLAGFEDEAGEHYYPVPEDTISPAWARSLAARALDAALAPGEHLLARVDGRVLVHGSPASWAEEFNWQQGRCLDAARARGEAKGRERVEAVLAPRRRQIEERARALVMCEEWRASLDEDEAEAEARGDWPVRRTGTPPPLPDPLPGVEAFFGPSASPRPGHPVDAEVTEERAAECRAIREALASASEVH